MVCRIAWIGFVAAIWLSGCGTAEPAGAPADFALAYDWREGTLPPPYHYSYQIVIAADGSGTISLTPDYAGPDVPTWVESFQLSNEQRDALYADLVAQDLLRERWRADPVPPVGGSSASMQVTANRRAIAVPSFVIAAQQSRAATMHETVEAQVPEAIWAQLMAQREAYVAERE